VSLVIYGLEPGKKKFLPLDAVNNVLVTNLIYASQFPDEIREALEKECKDMESNNRGYKFEVRRFGKNRAII